MALPQHVLVDQLSEAIQSRTVEAAVFTTFNFDPGFFELHILPTLFPDHQFSSVEQVRLLQLEDCLHDLSDLTVYFDASALDHDGVSPKLAYSRIDVHWRTGVFHPKLVLLLMRDPKLENQQSLLVVCQSANLTRAGWWENVECAHIEELTDAPSQNQCSFRDDLIELVDRIRSRTEHEDHSALERIRLFLLDRIEQSSLDPEINEKSPKTPTRLFGGYDTWRFPDWLTREAGLNEGCNLEIVSPYFDANNANALTQLIEATKPDMVRIYLPEAGDGTTLVTKEVFNEIDQMANVEWAGMPANVTKRQGAGGTDNVADRFVHAKIYRFWHRRHGDAMFIGSVNCTTPAHGSGSQGNLENGFFVDVKNQRFGRSWWLETAQQKPSREFIEHAPDEVQGNDRQLFDVYLKYNWASHKASVLVDGNAQFPILIEDPAGAALFSISSCDLATWEDCSNVAADKLQETLNKSSFVTASSKGSRWRLLVREEGYSHKPSLLRQLTPDEIFRYWSLLSVEQRAEFAEQRLQETLEGLVARPQRLESFVDSVFNQFSGVFHAFGHFRRHLEDSLAAGRTTEAEWRMFGTKYDSLPELLRKLLLPDEHDRVLAYVSFLTAKQIRNWLASNHRSFVSARSEMLKTLDQQLDMGLKHIRQELIEQDALGIKFLNWYDQMFLEEATN